MWQFLARNKPVAAMLGVLAVAAIVAIVMATKGSGHHVVEDRTEEPDDISDDPHIFATEM